MLEKRWLTSNAFRIASSVAGLYLLIKRKNKIVSKLF